MTGILTRLTISPPDGKVGQDAFAVIRDTIAKITWLPWVGAY